MQLDKLLPRYLLTAPEPHQQASSLHHAAVLVPLFEREHQLRLLLTQRAATMRHHKNEFCFPGGRREAHDSSLRATAIRETWEEIGLSARQFTIWGELPAHPTLSGYLLHPYLAVIKGTPTLRHLSSEVQRVIDLPLSYALNPGNYHKYQLKRQDHQLEVLFLPYRRYLIWGITARVLYQLAQRLPNR